MDYSNEQINDNANYILNILKSSGMIMLSWGVSGFKATVYREMMALQFKVNGLKHKGYVYVCYNAGEDVFEVFTMKRTSVITHVRDVYFDDLVIVIDELVEKGRITDEEYKKLLEQEYDLNDSID